MNSLRGKARSLLHRAFICTQSRPNFVEDWHLGYQRLVAVGIHTSSAADSAGSASSSQSTSHLLHYQSVGSHYQSVGSQTVSVGKITLSAPHSTPFLGTVGSNLRVPLFNWRREVVGEYTLPGDVFNVPIRKDVLHRVVRWQLAKRQQGTHKTKTRSEVRGGGRKPHSQKGSGRARFGSIRAAQRRGGGIIFGPVVRSHEHGLQKKVRKLGLKCALSAKASEGRLMVLDSLAIDPPKTKYLDEQLSALLPDVPRRSILLIDCAKDGADGGEKLRKAASNLPWTDVLPQAGANVYSILQRDNLILSCSAVDLLVQRLRQTSLRQPHDSVHA